MFITLWLPSQLSVKKRHWRTERANVLTQIAMLEARQAVFKALPPDEVIGKEKLSEHSTKDVTAADSLKKIESDLVENNNILAGLETLLRQ